MDNEPVVSEEGTRNIGLENKSLILEKLREQEVTVVFTKKNGEERTMKCTLNWNHIPPTDIPKGTGRVNTDENLQHVYDVESEGWRSFKWDSVKSFSWVPDDYEVQ